jgi:hypothetical protein
MDINALYSRDKAYYESIQSSLCMYLPELAKSLVAAATVSKGTTNVSTSIIAPFNPSSNSTIQRIQVLEKAVDEPTEYAVDWVSVDTVTASPDPDTVEVGDIFLISESEYEVSSIAGNQITFTTPVSEVSVFYATVATPDVTYQWQISEDEGATWADIVGATSRSYEAVGADVGDQLRVIISYVDGQGTIEEPSLSPPESQPGFIYPVFPVIADIELDLVRTYPANALVDLKVTVLSE